MFALLCGTILGPSWVVI